MALGSHQIADATIVRGRWQSSKTARTCLGVAVAAEVAAQILTENRYCYRQSQPPLGRQAPGEVDWGLTAGGGYHSKFRRHFGAELVQAFVTAS